MLVFRDEAKIDIKYPLEKLGDPEKILYFDIETTGLSRQYCFIYLIGCLYIEDGTPKYVQWMAENKNDEGNVLMAFEKFLAGFDTLIHFNGDSFDIPFVRERGAKMNIKFDFERMKSIDIFKSLGDMRNLLHLENRKQKTYEKLIGIDREDKFNGGQLIEVYHEFVRTKDAKLAMALLLHNVEDVINMGSLTSLLAISDMFKGKFQINDYSFNEYEGFDGSNACELKVQIDLENELPIDIAYDDKMITLRASGTSAELSVKAKITTLKIFYSNYKEYYYLPDEDKAIHKSVAQFVDRDYRKQATASTCYECREDIYFPIEDIELFDHTFRKEYSTKQHYVRKEDINDDNVRYYVISIFQLCL